MGARAHGRRHEGRAIRKRRRLIRRATESFLNVKVMRKRVRRFNAAMTGLGEAAARMAPAMAQLAASLPIEGGDAQSPTEGGEARRSPSRGLSAEVGWIDETHRLKEENDGA